MTVLVYGASDDLVEIEGSLREEFSAYNFDGYLAFSNGVLLSVRFVNPGTWRISAEARPDLVAIELAAGGYGEDDNGYPRHSDRAVVSGEIEWVVFSDRVVRS